MKLLYYNWVPFDDPEGRSGGVRIYQSNLINHLAAHTDHEIFMLSSGIEQDKFKPAMRFERTENALGSRVQSYAFVNSPVLAPGHHAFGSEHIFDEHLTLPLWHDFLREHGPFDVVQFDSLEGIPFTWLRIHEVHADTRVLFYAHNYYSVCPQVNLWKNEKENCVDYNEGRDCATCLPEAYNPNEILRARQLSRMLRQVRIRPGTRSYKAAYGLYARTNRAGTNGGLYRIATRTILGSAELARRARDTVRRPGSSRAVEPAPLPTPVLAAASNGQTEEPQAISLKKAPMFKHRREWGAELVNRETDFVLATSNRTAHVLAEHGIDPNRIEVCYIGTKAAEAEGAAQRRMTLQRPGKLTVAYLGYMRLDKGFAALLKALKKAPAELQERIRLVVAAKRTNEKTNTKLYDRLELLAQNLDDVLHYDGYTHENLATILDGVDVGIVPVQWEDNLPQVAIEMVAHGVPVLTSDRGGAQEIGGRNPAFTFEATSRQSLIERLEALVTGATPLSAFWDDVVELSTMEIHTQRLMEFYRPVGAAVTSHVLP